MYLIIIQIMLFSLKIQKFFLTENHWQKLLIKETLLMEEMSPALKCNKAFITLYLFNLELPQIHCLHDYQSRLAVYLLFTLPFLIFLRALL